MTTATSTGPTHRPADPAAPDRHRPARAAVVAALPAVAVMLAVLAGWRLLDRFDLAVVVDVHGWVLARPRLAETLQALEQLTHPTVWRVLAAVLVGVLWWRGRRPAALWLAVTMTVGSLLSPALKVAVGRPRPQLAQALTDADGYAFPSGHTLTVTVFAVAILVLARPARRVRWWPLAVTGAVALVALTGLGRVAVGAHYPSDVLAGWSLGLATVLAATTVTRRPR